MFQDDMIITKEANVCSWDVLLTSILDLSFSDTVKSHSESQWEKNGLCGVKLCSFHVCLLVIWSDLWIAWATWVPPLNYTQSPRTRTWWNFLPLYCRNCLLERDKQPQMSCVPHFFLAVIFPFSDCRRYLSCSPYEQSKFKECREKAVSPSTSQLASDPI